MPLVRKPGTAAPGPAPAAAPDAAQVFAGLTSANPDERWTAARAAVAVPGGSAAMAAALRTEAEPHICEALFTGLARIGSPDSTTELLSFLRSDQSAWRTGALDALRTIPGCVRDLLPQLHTDSDTDMRILCCELARTLPGEEATRVLCTLLATEPDVNVCAAAIDVLAEVGTPAACPVLAQCAARFPRHAFLGFAAKVAADRITSQSVRARD